MKQRNSYAEIGTYQIFIYLINLRHPLDMSASLQKDQKVRAGTITITYRIPFPGTWVVILKPVEGIFLRTLAKQDDSTTGEESTITIAPDYNSKPILVL